MSLAGVMFFGIAAALTAVMLKQGKSEYSMFVITAAVLFLFWLVLSQMQTIVDTIRQMQTYIYLDDEYLNILIKIVGICYLTQFAADLCKDCGYQSLANQLQIFGKISVLAVSMPVVLSLMETIHQVLG
jgi:stage III sporulation protein AD